MFMQNIFATFNSINDLHNFYEQKKIPNERSLILGGGSNILFTQDFDGIVLKNDIKGIEEIKEDNRYAYVKAGAGENWHRFVIYCINKNFGGVENLSLIPGNVGASPMQNIGAYGVEIKDVFYSLEAFHLKEKKIVTFTLNDCEFGYRESIFKKQFKNHFAILNVTYKLNKHPDFNISYGAIKDELQKMNADELTLKTISDAIISIRTSKLPDPKAIGNAGSFFKNPVITDKDFPHLKVHFPSMPFFKNETDQSIKVPAGWLIEQCGWKGYRKGDAGCYDKQALVLVNYGNAKGEEILN